MSFYLNLTVIYADLLVYTCAPFHDTIRKDMTLPCHSSAAACIRTPLIRSQLPIIMSLYSCPQDSEVARPPVPLLPCPCSYNEIIPHAFGPLPTKLLYLQLPSINTRARSKDVESCCSFGNGSAPHRRGLLKVSIALDKSLSFALPTSLIHFNLGSGYIADHKRIQCVVPMYVPTIASFAASLITLLPHA